MKIRAYIRMAAAVAAVLCLLCGCSLDVEQYLRPPKTRGEQQAVQQALETYIRDSGQSDSRYSLCYPVEGEHTAAFILCDAAGKPLVDTATSASLAVAFYATQSAPNDTHINLLRREANEWVSVADTVGGAADILQVAFGDLDGDGMAELITGWDTYNSRERRLTVFSLAGLTRQADDRAYTRLYVGNLTATDKDSLLLLRIAGDGVSATLEGYEDGKLTSRGQVWLDSDIQQFTGMALCRLAGGVHGLYVDAVKGTDTAITELIYVDGSGLHAPFCHQASRINTVTARPAGFAFKDIDGDALVEIPQCNLIASYTQAESTPDYAYETAWMAWDYVTGEWTTRARTVVNAADGYLIVTDGLPSGLTTEYAADKKELTLLTVADERPLLRLRPLTGKDDKTYTELFSAADGYAGCEVWFDDSRLDMNTVRYAVARLEG